MPALPGRRKSRSAHPPSANCPARLVGRLVIVLGHTLSRDLVSIIQGRGFKLDPVAIRIDDRMAQLGVNTFR